MKKKKYWNINSYVDVECVGVSAFFFCFFFF